MRGLRAQRETALGRQVTRWLPWLSWLGIVAGVIALVAISTRPEHRRVPDLVGRDRAAAVDRLESAGLRPRVIVVTGDAPAGRVLLQSPRAGDEVEEGDRVTLTVSRRPPGVAVPDVSRLRARAARASLERAGFWPRVARVASMRTPAGRVVGTSPAATSRAAVGARVALLVSTGPPRARVPRLRDLEARVAERRLLRAGFRVVVVERESLYPRGNVIGQFPAAGRRVRSRSLVRIVVAARPRAIPVPRVLGMNFEQAVSEVSAAGFAVDFDHRRVRRSDDVGRVLAQAPRARGRASRGSRVTLTIGTRR